MSSTGCSHVISPTTWAPNSEVEGLYDLLWLLITNCEQAGAISIIGGDFNARIGTPLPGDDFSVFGRSGTGYRNDRGVLLMQWTMQHGVLIQSRLDNTLAQDEAWTCRRAMDLSLIQLDYILTSPKFSIEKSWCAFSIPDWFRSSMCSLSVENTIAQTEKTKENFEPQKLAAQPG